MRVTFKMLDYKVILMRKSCNCCSSTVHMRRVISSGVFHLEEQRVLHEAVVIDEVEADCAQSQVQNSSSEVREDEERQDLTKRRPLRPRGGVHVRREDIPVRYVQHQVHVSPTGQRRE